MSITAHQRKFGVEIECGLPGGVRAAQALFVPKNGFSPGWYYKEDGSGVEATSPILKGASGFAELKRAYKILKDNGAWITIADGMHVHHDAADFRKKPEYCVALVKAWKANQAAIYEMIAPWRHGSTMCKAWTDADIKRIIGMREPPALGYKDLTFRLWRPTIEVRLHEGTLDFEAAEAWIKFVQKFLYNVLQESVPKVGANERAELLKRLNMPLRLREKIDRKIADKHVIPEARDSFDRKATGYENGMEGVIRHLA